MQDSDDSSEHQQQSPPRPKTSKKLTGQLLTGPSSTLFGYLTIEFFLKLRGLYVSKRWGYGMWVGGVWWCHKIYFRSLFLHACTIVGIDMLMSVYFICH